MDSSDVMRILLPNAPVHGLIVADGIVYGPSEVGTAFTP